MDVRRLFLAFILGVISTSSAENIALGKWTEQTGVYDGLTSDRAVDGAYGNSNGGQTNCAHPDTSSIGSGPAEWKVDLGGKYTINTITLYNSYDAYGSRRLGSLKVNVLDDAGLVVECGDKTTEGMVGEQWTTTCPADVIGRYVQVVRYGGFDTPRMTLCEVEVLGQLYEGIGYGKPTNQTGQYSDLSSDLAVDGRYGGRNGDQRYCAHPETAGVAEWWLNLEQTYNSLVITVHNTYETEGAARFTQFTVGIILDGVSDEVICGDKTTAGSPGEVVTFPCVSTYVAQYVRVRRYGGDRIILCEVDVTGSLACRFGYYGPGNCEMCGHCSSTPCNTNTGVCVGGCEIWWKGDTCKTPISRIDYTNEQISTSSSSGSTVSVEWDQISVPSGLEAYYKYRVSHSPSSGTDPRYVQQTAVVSRLSVTLDSLQPNTEYTLTVTPVREMGGVQDPGTPYPTQTVRTQCGHPGQIGIISVTSSDLTISIVYTVPNPTCDTLRDIILQYRLISEMTWSEQTASLQDSNIFVTVTTEGSYVIRLKVTHNQDLSSYSGTATITVLRTPTITTTTTMTTTADATSTIKSIESDINYANTVVPWALFGVVTGLLLASLGVNLYCWRRHRNITAKPASHHDYVNSDVIKPPVITADPEYELTDDVIRPRARDDAYDDINARRTGPYEDLGTRDLVPVSTYDEIR